ncbi:MAG: hypothetical protein PHT54_05185 [Candidatus Nanoarchaeia archaeon]|nr:hypothetical protein [Candidatus Nanoarchaeia archaeon]
MINTLPRGIESVPTFLSFFELNNIPFAIVEDRIHTVEKNTDSKDSLHYNFKKYGIEQSEEVLVLEKEFLEKNKELIENYMAWYIDKNFLSKINDSRARLHNLKESYEKIQDNSVERFIVVDVFNKFNNREIEKNLDNKAEEILNSSFVRSYPRISDIQLKYSLLGYVLGNALVMDHRVYDLEINSDQNADCLFFRKHKFNLQFKSPLINLKQTYSGLIKKAVEESALSFGQSFSEVLSSQKKVLDSLEGLVNRENSFKNNNRAEDHNIGFEKMNNNIYGIYMNLSPFLVKKKENYYHFEKAKIGFAIKVDGTTFRINDAPRILDGYYVHPFVNVTGYICFGKTDWESIGVNFTREYDFYRSRDASAETLANILRRGEMNLTRGHFGKMVNGFSDFSNIPIIARSRYEALNYARRNSIPEWRIYNND